MSIVWVNGALVDKNEARVSPFDHGFLYGDGVWEPLRVFGGRLFRPADHLARLYAAAGVIDLAIPHPRDELTAAIEATVRANHRTDGYIRVIVSRGPGTIGPDPRKIDPQVFIIAEEYQPFPAELYGHGLHAVTSPVVPDRSNPALRVRTLGRPDLVLAKWHALRNGCLEAVVLGPDGRVVGATEGAVLAVVGGTVCILNRHAEEAAQEVAIELIKEARLPVGWGEFRPETLVASAEVFLAGTSCGIIGIVRLDGKDIGSGTEGPVTRAVREAYRRLTRGDAPAANTIPPEGGGP